MNAIYLTQDDNDLITLAAGAGGCSLNTEPGKNWVEKSGGLPEYICKIARAIAKGSKGKSSAIAIAISRVKVWAAGGGNVDADTRAKAAKALAQWEALKARNKARKVALSQGDDRGDTYLQFSNTTSFNTEIVNRAWNARQDEARRAARAAAPAGSDSYGVAEQAVPYTWIKELWTDFVIVNVDNREGGDFIKVPYTVSDEYEVEFGEPTEVKQTWTEVDEDDDLSQAEQDLLADILLAPPQTAGEKMIRLAASLGFHIS